MKSPSTRKPATFRLDDPRLLIEAAPLNDDAGGALVGADQPVAVLAAARQRKRIPWLSLFWSAATGLVMMALGLAVTSLIEDLAARAPWLGAMGMAFAAVALLALLIVIGREVAGLWRLSTVESLRERAAAVWISDDHTEGGAVVAELMALAQPMPRLARGRARLEQHRGDIIDGRDLVRLAEQNLMAPLDADARRIVTTASKRVSVVTAISPRASVDMIFVLINALRMIRQLATLYGSRPGTLGLLKLVRQVVSHLALTGGIGLADGVLQQVIGHGLAARLSARLGEGMVNGLLTARLGLATIDLVRPLPFQALPRPALNDLAGTLLEGADSAAAAPAPSARIPSN